MAKANTERMIYQAAEQDGSFEAMAILPVHVIGPLMTANHDQGWSWQNCMKPMMAGQPYAKTPGGRMLWNIVDITSRSPATAAAARPPFSRSLPPTPTSSGEALQRHHHPVRCRQNS